MLISSVQVGAAWRRPLIGAVTLGGKSCGKLEDISDKEIMGMSFEIEETKRREGDCERCEERDYDNETTANK